MYSNNNNITIDQDPALWPAVIDDIFISDCIRKGPSYFQNNDGRFVTSRRKYKKQNRYLSSKLFKVRHPNGEICERKWLIYSKSTGVVFCFACKLFDKKSENAFVKNGFCDWKKAKEKTRSHENSSEHRKSLLTWISRTHDSHHVDKNMTKWFQLEVEYWRNVLKRVVEVVKFIAERGLAFRGTTEKFGSSENGNYLGILELIAKFDPFLYNHIEKYANKGIGNVSYLSKTICEEFILLMGNKVFKQIVKTANTIEL